MDKPRKIELAVWEVACCHCDAWSGFTDELAMSMRPGRSPMQRLEPYLVSVLEKTYEGGMVGVTFNATWVVSVGKTLAEVVRGAPWLSRMSRL